MESDLVRVTAAVAGLVAAVEDAVDVDAVADISRTSRWLTGHLVLGSHGLSRSSLPQPLCVNIRKEPSVLFGPGYELLVENGQICGQHWSARAPGLCLTIRLTTRSPADQVTAINAGSQINGHSTQIHSSSANRKRQRNTLLYLSLFLSLRLDLYNLSFTVSVGQSASNPMLAATDLFLYKYNSRR